MLVTSDDVLSVSVMGIGGTFAEVVAGVIVSVRVVVLVDCIVL